MIITSSAIAIAAMLIAIPAVASPRPSPSSSFDFCNPMIEQISPAIAQKKERTNPTIASVFVWC